MRLPVATVRWVHPMYLFAPAPVSAEGGLSVPLD